MEVGRRRLKVEVTGGGWEVRTAGGDEGWRWKRELQGWDVDRQRWRVGERRDITWWMLACGEVEVTRSRSRERNK